MSQSLVLVFAALLACYAIIVQHSVWNLFNWFSLSLSRKSQMPFYFTRGLKSVNSLLLLVLENGLQKKFQLKLFVNCSCSLIDSNFNPLQPLDQQRHTNVANIYFKYQLTKKKLSNIVVDNKWICVDSNIELNMHLLNLFHSRKYHYLDFFLIITEIQHFLSETTEQIQTFRFSIKQTCIPNLPLAQAKFGLT